MKSGGYPELVVKSLEPRGYMDVLFNSLLFKDVVKRHNIRFINAIDNLSSYLVNNVSGKYSLRKLTNVLKFKSDITLEKYLRYLTEAYIIFSLNCYSAKAGERLKSPKKIYIVDNGFINAKAVQHSPDTGRLMENLVFTELVKHGKEPNRDLFYYKTRNEREVDFVLKQGIEITELIQVCYETSNYESEQRETKALIEAGEELNVKNLIVITWNEKREIKKAEGIIRFYPLLEWLGIQA